jgi:cytochrome c-type biogenesis protein
MTLDIQPLTAFLAGLASFLSPCILPIVPPYLAFLSGASLSDLAERRDPALVKTAFVRAAAFVAGFTAVFVAMGAGASTVGRFIGDHLTSLSIVGGVIIAVLGLHMLGAFKSFTLMREWRFQATARPASALAAFVVGLAFAFGWSPCVGPILAAILFMAGAEATALRGGVLLFAYAAGIGVPFLLAAAFTGPFARLARRLSGTTGVVEKVMGGLLVLAGGMIATGTMASVAGWLLETFPIFATLG